MSMEKRFSRTSPLFLFLRTPNCFRDPGAIRTRDLLLRRQLLYPAELRDQLSVFDISQKSSINEKDSVSSESFFRSGWQDSNLRPPAPKAGAIPGYATPRILLAAAKIIMFFNSVLSIK